MSYYTYIEMLSKTKDDESFEEIDFDSGLHFSNNTEVLSKIKDDGFLYIKTLQDKDGFLGVQGQLFSNIKYIGDELDDVNKIFDSQLHDDSKIGYNFLVFLKLEDLFSFNNIKSKEDIIELYDSGKSFVIIDELTRFILYGDKVKDILLRFIEMLEAKNKEVDDFLNNI